MHKNITGVVDTDKVTDIVARDYRTADIFQHYGIDFCCGGKLPLNVICSNKEINQDELIAALNEVSNPYSLSLTMAFDNWSVDFLLDFIINIHHDYLRRTMPVLSKYIIEFEKGHGRKFPFIENLKSEFDEFIAVMLPKIREEEDIVFPYIRQIAHAYQNTEPYARLLVQTLRKPLDTMMLHNHEFITYTFNEIRRLTNHYTLSADSCTTHQVLIKKLQELDNDIFHHIYLENNILYPRTIAMEKELLTQSGV